MTRARLSLLLPVLALLAGALGLFVSTPAQAQSTVLVSNVSPDGSAATVSTFAYAQGFTTGGSSNGYTLHSIGLKLVVSGTVSSQERDTIKVELWSNSNGAPGSKVADLTVPSSVTSGNVDFAATSGTTLSANTTYHVVIYTTGGTFTKVRVRRVAADGEDPGAASGWSIADNSSWASSNGPTSSTTWTSSQSSVQIRVNGSAGQSGGTQSTDATLSGLEATSSTSSTGTFLSLPIGSFAASTTSYMATVGRAITHVKLTPTVNDSGATVKVGKGTSLTTVTSGSASSAIALSYGANALKVEVTAEDGTTKKTYTVTVARQGVGSVSLSASPNPVPEGGTVTVKITLSGSPPKNVDIPVTLTAGTAESDDFDGLPAERTYRIHAGSLVGQYEISTSHDADDIDETFTVSLGTLPSGYTAGSPSSVQITIADDEAEVGRPDSPAASPALARLTVWETALDVQDLFSPNTGCSNVYEAARRCSSVLSDDRFTFGGRTYVVTSIFSSPNQLFIQFDRDATAAFTTLKANVDTGGGYRGYRVDRSVLASGRPGGNLDIRNGPHFSAGSTVLLRLLVPVRASLSASRTTVPEGTAAEFRLQVSGPLPAPESEDVDIPIVVAGTDTEDGDLATPLPNRFRMAGGMRQQTFSVSTERDADGDDERFTVALDEANLPVYMAAGSPSEVEITIDDDAEAEVSLSVSPQWVPEGDSVTVTATLTQALRGPEIQIPVALTPGTAECTKRQAGSQTPGQCDYGHLRYIAIPAGATTGTATLATNRDADGDHETFTVALDPRLNGRLPSRVAAGSPPSVEVTIIDAEAAAAAAAGNLPLIMVMSGSTAEAAGKISFDLYLNAGAAAHPVSLDYATTDVSEEYAATRNDCGKVTFGANSGVGPCRPATAGVDYTPVSGTVVFEPGETRKKVSVPVINDSVEDSGEIFRLVMSNPQGGRLSQTSVEATILNDELVTIVEREPEDETVEPQRTNPHAALIAKVKGWRNDPRWVGNSAHTDRWDRVLLALGEPVADASLTAMTAAEAQAFADRGWARWVEVARALRAIEGGGTQPPPAPALPVVTVAAGPGVTEGASAGFTLTASPAPAADLAVSVSVSQRGAFADASALGARTVTIAAGETTAAFTVATMGDDADEPDGAVTAAVQAGDGYTVGSTATASVPVADDDLPPPAIATEMSIAVEGSDEAVVFAVTLSHAAAAAVTVDWATADSPAARYGAAPATAGADYTASSGTLTFPAGTTAQTVRVPVLDDAIDEDFEHFLLRFSNPQGATLASRETVGFIRNDDHLQTMWLARFGRAVGTQAVEAIAARFADDGGASRLTLAGATLGGSAPAAPPDDDEQGRLAAMSEWLRQQGDGDAPQPQARDLTPRELLLGSSFRLAGGGDHAGAPQWSAWGRFAIDAFDAEVEDLQLSGEVTTGFLGADYARGRWLAGLAVGLSEGDGPFTLTGDANTSRPRGTVEMGLTTVFPYVRLAASERLDFWAVGGVGEGTMTVLEEGGSTLQTGTRLRMAALGSRGTLLGGGTGGGFELALKSDVMFVRMRSDGLGGAAGSLAAASADVSRLRILVQGSHSLALGGGNTLRPSLELGVRHDGGDADTGTGVEAGVRLAWATTWGLIVDASVRGLLAHEAAGHEEWGASAALRFDPGGGLGLTASLAPVWGAAASGVERLWGQPAAGPPAPGAAVLPTGRLEAELGYGLRALRGRGVLTPYVRAALLEDDRQAWQLGTRLALADRLDLSLEASRRDGAADPEHAVALNAAVGW